MLPNLTQALAWMLPQPLALPLVLVLTLALALALILPPMMPLVRRT
jgi:hypothetical protein